jgi:TonB family protein
VTLREKFGRLVLLEETESSALGREYRAARLGPGGLDRLVSVLRFAPAISQDAAATKRLMDEARLAARLSNPGLQRVLGIGRVDQTFYVSTELVEGRSLAAVIERCAREAFPFAADHALMVASRTASALEYLHGKKDDAGASLFHGLLAPRHLAVAFDGEVKLKGLGLWPALRGSELLPEAERAFLAPEQSQGGAGDARSDVYSLGRVLLASITLAPPDGRDPLATLAEARLIAPTGEAGPVPKPLADLLRRALAADPEARYASIADMRKAVDTLLFSGDFTPTTFDLAFFMHTLYREEMEAESRALDEERRADYHEFLAEEKPSPVASSPAPSGAGGAPSTPTDPGASAPEAEPTVPTAAESARPTDEQRVPVTEPAADAAPRREPASRSREAAAREAAARMSLGAAPERRGSGLMVAVGVAVVALAAAGGWFVMARGRPAPSPSVTPPASSAEAEAALARVKELETRIAQLESEKAAAEAKAAEDARKTVEAQAAAKGQAADPQDVEHAAEEARRRARAEQEASQQEELRRLADARRLEEKRIADASPVPAANPVAPTPSPTPTPTPPPPPTPTPTPAPEATPTVTSTPGVVTPTPPGATPTPVPAAAPEVALVPPAVISQAQARYPPLAQQRAIPGVVEVSALVDEEGKVSETTIVRAEPKKLGFEEAALAHVRSRRYRPATRDGVPVRVWVSIVVEFKPKK